MLCQQYGVPVLDLVSADPCEPAALCGSPVGPPKLPKLEGQWHGSGFPCTVWQNPANSGVRFVTLSILLTG